MGVEFLIDESQREAEEINKIAKEFDKPIKKESKNARILKKFIIALYHAGSSEHEKKIEKIKEETVRKIVEQFPGRREIERRSIKEFKPSILKEEPKRELPIPPRPSKLIEEFKEENKYPLIVSRKDNKIMASARVNEKYELIEPGLSKVDIDILNRIRNVSEKSFDKVLRKLCKQFKIKFDEDYSDKIKYYLKKELGKIDPLFKDPKISSISVDGIERKVNVVYDGKKLVTNIEFKNVDEINDVINKLARKLGKKASAYSTLEGTLDNGFRVQAMLGSDQITPRFTIEKR